MATPVSDGRTREKSSSLRSMRESIRPITVESGKDSSGTRSCEESSLESSSVKFLSDLVCPTVGGDMNSATRLKGTVSTSVLQLERVLSVEENKFLELVFSLGRTSNDDKPILISTRCRTSYHLLATLHE